MITQIIVYILVVVNIFVSTLFYKESKRFSESLKETREEFERVDKIIDDAKEIAESALECRDWYEKNL